MNVQEGLYKKLVIHAITEEVKGFKTFAFEEGHGIHYRAGQYLTFVQFLHGTEVRRSYSITSAPSLREPLTIGVKRVENGIFSRQLIDHAKPGDELLTTGSGGFFVLPDDVANYKQLFFFAAGSGITPVYSLIKTALHQHPHLSLVLVYSNASAEKTIFLPSLQKLQKRFPQRFHLELLFSNSIHLLKARLHRDLIVQFVRQLSVAEKDKRLFYICGPENYMRLCTYTLQEHGISPANIKRENFIIHTAPKRDRIPPDKADRKALIHIGDSIHNITVHYPDSILKAARKEGMILPYSCDAGRCGNCVAKCTKGTVWHSYNEVLTEKELQKGLVLTCVGHPVGGDVELLIG
jgi:ring-1,2-phenylacetyl-CoA epoxidase subunit PaaE